MSVWHTLMASAVFFGQSILANGGISHKITGKVTDPGGSPVPYATVNLLKSGDSSFVSGDITDSAGIYHFQEIPAGAYLISVTAIGYQRVYSRVFRVNPVATNRVLPALVLPIKGKLLQGVNITATKPFIEHRLDRTIIHVANSIVSSGETAMDVLRKVPGVYVDKDGNISLQGKQGVQVMIDGKLSYLSAADLASMLNNMPSGSINQIVLMTNPPAKYDAAGSAGIINIQLKKNSEAGFNGSVMAGTSTGIAFGGFPGYNSGINLNDMAGKFNIYGNYNASWSDRPDWLNLTRWVNAGKTASIFQQHSLIINRELDQDWKLGMDISLDKRNSFGFMVTGFNNLVHTSVGNGTDIQDSQGLTDSSLYVSSLYRNRYNSITYDASYKRAFDTSGRELEIDLDYSDFGSLQVQQINNYYYDQAGNPSEQPVYLRSNAPSTIIIRSARMDYSQPIFGKGKFEAGWKTSWVSTDNNLLFDSLALGTWLKDNSLTNHFVYNENINAAYINVHRDFSRMSIQLGLRAEQTRSMGNSLTTGQVVNRSYLDLFPTAFVSRKLSSSNQLTFSYSRRIDRPDYQDLNPFLFFLDQYTYQQGNPFLNPQYTNNFSITHIFKGIYSTSLSYSHTRDPMVQTTQPVDSTGKITKAIRVNLTARNVWDLSFSAPLDLSKWWTVNLSLDAFYMQFIARDFLGGNLNNAQASLDANADNSIKLPGNWKAELSMRYQSPLAYGVFRIKSQYEMDAGLEKSLWHHKADLKLNVNDIFNSWYNRLSANYGVMNLYLSERWSFTRANLTLTWHFGKKNPKAPATMHTGIQEEENRIKK